MTESFLTTLLPQLASGAAHTHALGFAYEGLEGDRVRMRAPYRDDLVGDPETGVLAGGLVTTLLDHAGGLAVWAALDTFRPIATLDLRVDYMRAAQPGRDLLAEARCYRLTRNLAFVRAPISRLRRHLRLAATPGEHDAVIVPDGPSEIRDLGSDAEALRRALVHEIDESDAAREALEQEGPVVDAIRRELTARAEVGPAGVQIAGVLRPAEGVLAGDFWDRIPLPDGRAAAVICDVSGHGPRAGIVAMRLKTSITLGLIAGQDPPQILHRACDAFADEPGRFATVVILLADPRTGRLDWVNAGHPAPRVVRADGTIERLDPTGPMVSWLIGGWTSGSMLLGPRDLCLAFTDGILESRDADGQELGDVDLDARIRAAAEASSDPAEVTAQVLAAVRERADDLGRDDVTLVALRMDPQPQPVRRIPAPRR